MARENIDFGIDLGTTTSIIAVATADDATVIRNNRQMEYTPSAVHISGSNKILVGESAKGRLVEDHDNASAEFKLQMGKRDAHKHFKASGRSMSPEQLSAEVLKSLRGDVQQSSLRESIGAAVITVPAAFELDQCDATRKAAELAGLDFAPLIQEPSAAAWAYSTHLATDRGFWLVYDFGGGTFDAAIVKVADGEFSTINHAGDNFLGGKLIDWALVEGLLIPAVRKEFPLPDLARGHRKSAGNIAKLKQAAEYAKIELSRADSAEINLRLNDADGTPAFDFLFDLTREDVERVAMPLYQRSVTLCRKAIADAGLGGGDIERVLLVGGTTIAPALREMLADPAEGLGIPLDYSLDPVTVVARGAAIFAGTQQMPHRPERAEQALGEGKVVLNLKYPAAGSDNEPLVGGLPPRTTQQRDWTGSTIEFVHPDGTPPWRSGQIPLTPEGTFSTRLRADEQTVNTYDIELRDARGTVTPTDPERISYRHTSKMGTAPTLSHSIGVALDNNEVLWLVRKGAELPATARAILYSTLTVRRNERTGLIRVPIVEGERSKADRNMLIGRLDIVPNQVDRDVPAGSEVEVTLKIDTSFAPRADAYVPLVDEEFQIQVELGRSGAGTDFRGAAEDLADRFTELVDRLDKLRFGDVDPGEAAELVDRFRGDDVPADVRRLADAAAVDPDAASTCENRLRDAQTALDDIEAALVFPELVTTGRTIVAQTRGLIEDSGVSRQRTALHNAERAMEAAIASHDRTVLERQIDVVRDIVREVLRDSGQLAAVIFAGREPSLRDNQDPRVQELLQMGRRALDEGDVARLNAVNAQLEKAAPDAGGYADGSDGLGSTVRAGDL